MKSIINLLFLLFLCLILNLIPYTDSKQFQKLTDSYRIYVVYSENSLMIALADFEQQTVYFKKLTEKDIGGQINKKADLAQIYYYLNLPYKQIPNAITQGDTQIEKQRQHYQFSSNVMYGNISCYKIQHGGKITVYGSFQNLEKRKISYQSKILLKVHRKMTQSDIFKQKYVTVLQSKIIKMRKDLWKDLKIIEYQNEFLSKQIRDIKLEQQKLEQKLKRLEAKMR